MGASQRQRPQRGKVLRLGGHDRQNPPHHKIATVRIAPISTGQNDWGALRGLPWSNAADTRPTQIMSPITT